MKDTQKAFTIIEMMIVGIVLSILCVFAVSQFRGLQRIADIKNCKENIMLLHKAVERFGYEQGRLPSLAEFNYPNLTYYGADNKTFYCPSNSGALSYALNTTAAGIPWDDYINGTKFPITNHVVEELGVGHKDKNGNVFLFNTTIEGVQEPDSI